MGHTRDQSCGWVGSELPSQGDGGDGMVSNEEVEWVVDSELVSLLLVSDWLSSISSTALSASLLVLSSSLVCSDSGGSVQKSGIMIPT